MHFGHNKKKKISNFLFLAFFIGLYTEGLKTSDPLYGGGGG